jgi:hypothetical protein
MSEQLNTLSFNLSVQAIDGEFLPSAIYRVVLDVSYGYSVGRLQKGYYVKFNDNVHFISQQSIQISTVEQATKVFAFLQKTQVPFAITLKHEQTRSGYQYVQLHYINLDSQLYTLKQFQAYKGLWRAVEGALYQPKDSTIAKFSDKKLDWVVELVPQEKLSFTQPSTISATLFATQGHLEVFKLAYDDVFAIPFYLYKRAKVLLFNHSIEKDVIVIPLGLERKIIKVTSEATQVVSEDHNPISLPQGEYLLFHPLPRQDAVD